MKIESFVEDLLKLLKDEQFDYDADHCLEIEEITDQLNKMATLQGKEKKKQHYLNYWKVTQALAELGFDRIVSYTNECNRDQGLAILVHCTNNSAALRRFCAKREELFEEIVFPCVVEVQSHNEDHCYCCIDLQHCLVILYRMLLMANPGDVAALFDIRTIDKKGNHSIILEICNIVKQLIDCVLDDGLHGSEPASMLLYCAKILQYVSETAAPEQVRKLIEIENKNNFPSAKLLNILAKHNSSGSLLKKFPRLQIFINIAKTYNQVIQNKPGRRDVYDFATKTKAERLSLMEFKGDYFVFCSSPECRKVEYADKKLRHCAKCMLARYCSSECQIAHWKSGHNKTCIPFVKLK